MLQDVGNAITKPPRTTPLATFADWLAIADDEAVELLEGELVRKASPLWGHAEAQGRLVQLLAPFARRPGGKLPGGWYFLTELDVRLSEDTVVRPDLTGYRRENVPVAPKERATRLRPDWVCEVLSDSNRRNDLVRKLRLYQAAQVPHYWVVDPEQETLTAMRLTLDGYVNAVVATAGERVRVEPFAELEWPVAALFGEDPDPEPQLYSPR